MEARTVIVLCGGESSSEREVSLMLGEMVYERCRKIFNTKKIVLSRDELPKELVSQTDAIIFPTTLGAFGEDGQLQSLMEKSGLTFVGSGPKASKIGMDKHLAKQVVSKVGIPVVEGIKFSKHEIPPLDEMIKKFGEALVVKPNAGGSSIDVNRIFSKKDLERVMAGLEGDGEYILEKQIRGSDLSVGVLEGHALEIVEIISKHGFCDYDSKYVPGAAEKICPANIPSEKTKEVKRYAEMAFTACGCRDHARCDFMLTPTGEIYFLEINTLPCVGPNSLFPISAAGAGFSYEGVLRKLVDLASTRLQ
jgi:D-alanine-D-alanine ligase